MNNQDWITLQILYKSQSISQAANILYITQPSLTKRIQKIEREFSIEIVKRSVKGIQFTLEGEYLAKQAEKNIKLFNEIQDYLNNFKKHTSGTLRIGVSNFISKYKLPKWLAKFRKLYPDVMFHVETGYSEQIYQLAYNQDIHIGFLRGEYNWPEKKDFLFEESFCIAAKNPINLKKLPSIPRINYKTDTLYEYLVNNWWSERYAEPPMFITSVDRGDTCKEMVIHGLGYAILPSLFLEDTPYIYQTPLQKKNGDVITQKTWMIYSEQDLKLNIVNTFVNFIRELEDI